MSQKVLEWSGDTYGVIHRVRHVLREWKEIHNNIKFRSEVNQESC